MKEEEKKESETEKVLTELFLETDIKGKQKFNKKGIIVYTMLGLCICIASAKLILKYYFGGK